MTPAEKYAKVLSARKKKIYKAEDECGFGRNTLSNAIRDNRELSEEYHKKFMTVFSVNPAWWRTEKGEMFEVKPTSVQNPGNNAESQEANRELQRKYVESLERYIGVQEKLLTDLRKRLKEAGLSDD